MNSGFLNFSDIFVSESKLFKFPYIYVYIYIIEKMLSESLHIVVHYTTHNLEVTKLTYLYTKGLQILQATRSEYKP